MQNNGDALLQFLNATPTPFHTVAESAACLEKAGFLRLDERQPWDLQPGGTYYLTRNGSALIAFRLPECPGGQCGCRIALAHTDSPALKLKTKGAETIAGQLHIPVDVYGSPIYSTWLDKPLGVAGRIFTIEDDRPVEHRVATVQPVAVIHNPPVHFADLNGGFT